MAYTVLARRYRPQRFDDVVGQDAISQTLKNAIKTGRVAHAYLFTGTRGVGKTTMARILAKSLNCLSAKEPTIEPCLKCDSCANVNTGEDIDVIEIDGASNRGIENVRELRQNAIYRPARARYKIYIIDEVHMLTTEAFNALLKILEEPPAHIKFIFATTEPNKVPATIQSRCQRFDFANISPADIMAQLKKILTEEKINFEDDCIIALARLANGSMRDALSLVDQLISTGVEKLTVGMLEKFLGQPNKEKIYELLEKIGSSDAAGALVCVDALLNCGLNCIGVLDSLVESFRDMMVLKVSASDSKSLIILTQVEKDALLRIADGFEPVRDKTSEMPDGRLGRPVSNGFDIPSIVYNVTLFEKLRWPVKNSDNPRALLEAAILRLALSEHFMSVPELLLSAKGCLTAQGGGVKKNTIPKIEHPGEIAEAASHGASRTHNTELKTQTPVISGGADIEQIKQKWDKIVEFVRSNANGRVAELLKKAVPLRLNNGTLSLGFGLSDEFSMKLCQSNGRAEVIESVLSGSIGTKIKAAFETVNNGGKVEQKPKPPGAKTSKKTIDEAARTPAIRTILSELDANILDVKEEGQ